MYMPKVSVITINYNNANGLKSTLESVINQDYSDFEYILIDGGSKDDSVRLIKKYEKMFQRRNINFFYVSESDKGIYDAMNKGIDRATGKWIHFLNSGDCYYSENVLQNVFGEDDYEDADIVYGKWKKIKQNQMEDGNVYFAPNVLNVKEKDLKLLKPYPKKGVLFTAHIAMFFRTSVAKKRLYDLDYHICADLDWCMEAYHKGKVFAFVNEYICLFDLNGVSSKQLVERYKETVSIRHKYGTEDFVVIEKIKLLIWYLIEKISIIKR